MTLVLSSCDKHVLGFYYKGNIFDSYHYLHGEESTNAYQSRKRVFPIQ